MMTLIHTVVLAPDLSKKPIGQLHQTVVIGSFCTVADPANVLVQPVLTPVISGRFLGARGFAGTRSFE